MQTQSLNGAWQFRSAAQADWLPATVPGGAHTDLLAAGHIPDPFVGDNELAVQWVAESDWVYRRRFTPEAELARREHVALVCDGLDTLAEVQLNGHRLGAAANMFRQYRWEIKEYLRPGENELTLHFRSPVKYAAAQDDLRHLLDVGDPLRGGQYLRKAPSHFGWDWGPKLPAIGIWRAIRLEGYDHARLEDVLIRQRHSAEAVRLTVAARAEAWDAAALALEVTLTAPDGAIQTARVDLPAAAGELEFILSEPRLWWPNGLGEQALYQMAVTLTADGQALETRRYTVGLRTVELRQQPDEWGRSFTFVVNGVPLFAKGTNWIPADSFPARVTEAQLEALLGSAAACHHNMIRVWGGGYYESEAFYDLCDRLGLLVWQDFMFACAVYPFDDPAFLDNLRVEVNEQVRRLRHRACLALWCGNNEMEAGWVDWGWSRPETQALKAAYTHYFYATLPHWLQALDGDHAYWPSSPSSNLPLEAPQSDAQGDTHLWSVWGALKPFEDYQAHFSRFVSEFGFQSLPGLATLAAYAEPADWNPTSYVLEHHQRHPGGNGKIITYLTEHFRLPKDFRALVYLSQLLQAEAMRVGVEHWRRHTGRCSGALYWQLNDCWPVASWSSIDYFGRWKALQYVSRRLYAPVLLSIAASGLRRQLVVANDQPSPWEGCVRWSLQTFQGKVVQQGEQAVTAGPLAATSVIELDFSGAVTAANRREVALVCDLVAAGRVIATQLATFAPNKHLNLPAPGLTARVEVRGEEIAVTVTCQQLARFVEVTLEGVTTPLSDNYFDLPAGRAVTVMVARPAGWTEAQAAAAVRLCSLYNTY